MFYRVDFLELLDSYYDDESGYETYPSPSEEFLVFSNIDDATEFITGTVLFCGGTEFVSLTPTHGREFLGPSRPETPGGYGYRGYR